MYFHFFEADADFDIGEKRNSEENLILYLLIIIFFLDTQNWQVFLTFWLLKNYTYTHNINILKLSKETMDDTSIKITAYKIFMHCNFFFHICQCNVSNKLIPGPPVNWSGCIRLWVHREIYLCQH